MQNPPDGSNVYVTNLDGTVSIISTTTSTVTATVNVGSTPGGVIVTPDGSQLYVTNSGSNNVSVINTTTNTVTATVNTGNGPGGVAVIPTGTNYTWQTLTAAMYL